MRSLLILYVAFCAFLGAPLRAEEMSIEELTNLEPLDTTVASPVAVDGVDIEIEAEKQLGEWANMPWPQLPSRQNGHLSSQQ
jgi:hypothetical protein